MRLHRIALVSAEAESRKAPGVSAGVPEEEDEPWSKDTPGPRPGRSAFVKRTRSMSTLARGSESARKSRVELRNAAYLAVDVPALAEADVPIAAPAPGRVKAFCDVVSIERAGQESLAVGPG